MSVSIELQNLYFSYKGIGALDSTALTNINLRLRKVECTAIVGQSGSGKTTLIQQFTGLLQPDAGQVLFNGQDIWQRKFNKTELRRRIGLVFQFPETQLFEETIAKDIAFGPKNLGWSADRIEQNVTLAMQQVGLDPQRFRHSSPFHLSEGEKRRVAIAGVLSMEPEMLVFDEPTAGLDPQNVERIEKIIRNLILQNKSVVLVTHNMDLVSRICHRVVVMRQGEKVFDNTPRELFKNAELLQGAGLLLPNFLQEFAKYRHRLPLQVQDVLTFSELQQALTSAL